MGETNFGQSETAWILEKFATVGHQPRTIAYTGTKNQLNSMINKVRIRILPRGVQIHPSKMKQNFEFILKSDIFPQNKFAKEVNLI